MDAKDFPKKLNEFIEEEIPVQKINFDPDTKKTSIITTMEKQKVMYIDAPVQKMRCKDGDHVFKSIDPHKGLFSCTKCRFSRQVYPSTYKFENGKLIHKFTGKIV